MIHPHWSVVDLDPITWRNIGAFISPGRYVRAGDPGERALYVLHDNGRVLNAVDTASGRRIDLGLARIDDPDGVAADLFDRGEWDRIHLVDRQHVAAVAHEAQSDPRHGMTLDQYYRLVYHLTWSNSDSRYVVHPPRKESWHGWTYGMVQDWLGTLPDPATVALGVVGDGGLQIGVYAQIEDQLITVLSTFESLPVPREAAAVSADYRDRIWDAIADKFAPPAALLLCRSEVFDRWIHQQGKRKTIVDAVADGTAFTRFAAS
jgi:hypothetical protein